MCGIAGVLHFERQRAADPELVDRMTGVLAHRGPDGQRTHFDGPLGLGHRRLAIIDLSPEADQPLANEDGTVWVVLNGEIYNFRDLRHELAGKGHVFRSRSDTEVLVHLYEEAGDGMIERLRGMFALAIWDARRRRLLLARDRFGEKPLYYRLTPSGLHFASEIKGILQDPGVPREPDLEALDGYLTYGYVPGPATAFAGIRRLPPAHLMTVEADGASRLRRYWRLRMAPKAPREPGRAERRRAEERVLELLDESTRLRMITDVPLGAFLSGGLDSSAVVASMCAAASGGSRSVKTFSIGFDDRRFDERDYAEEVARHLGTDHRLLVLGRGSLAELDRIAWHYGEPFADPSCVPTFSVARLARRQVTVALSGDGGDELFCGYKRYQGARLDEWLRPRVAPLRAAASNRTLEALVRLGGFSALARELGHRRERRQLDAGELYLTRLELLGPGLRERLLSEAFRRRSGAADPRRIVLEASAASDGETFTERCAHADALTYLPDDILVKVDVAAMAHGLESRAPLLDHDLAETVAALPFRLKMSGLGTKRVLRGAVAGRLPERTLTRPKKGFGIPLATWFEGDMAPVLRDTLLDRRALERGLLRRAGVESLFDEHAAGRADHQKPLFGLLMLELWHRQWIDPPQGQAPAESLGDGGLIPRPAKRYF